VRKVIEAMCGPVLGGERNLVYLLRKSGHGVVAALAEKVGFANGLVGERSVEGEGGRC